MVGEYVLSNAHNLSVAPKFATSFCPFYFVAQEANVAPRVSTSKQVIQTDGLASSSSHITKARGVQASYHNLFVLSTQKRNAPCWQGGRRLLHHKLLGHQILVSQ
jgi:hypothetical protein